MYLSVDGNDLCEVITSAEGWQDGVRIYPNPFTDGVQIELPGKVSVGTKAVVTDMAGRIIDEFVIDEPTFYWSVKGRTDVAPGVYQLSVEMDGERHTYKLLKLNNGQ